MISSPEYSSGETGCSMSFAGKMYKFDNLKHLIPEAWWPMLIEASRQYQDKRDDAGHAVCVTARAADLLAAAGSSGSADRRVVLAAALLHDIGWSCIEADRRFSLFAEGLPPAVERQLRREHERLGSLLAEQLMNEAGVPVDIIPEVCRLIDGHDTREGFISEEDGILRDADKLWMVSRAGFDADLRRRNLSAAEWSLVLRERFSTEGELYYSESAETAFEELEKLEHKPRVLIAHYRVGWTDGVSLEIEKRKVILEEMGFEVLLLSGPGSRGADYVIDELDFESDDVKLIARNAFGSLGSGLSETELGEMVIILADIIENKLAGVIIEAEPDFILTHNIFSHGRHIAAARAFCKVLKSYGAASLTTHHDFYWERDDFREPSCEWVRGYLAKYVPPEIPHMRHAVINSLAAVELEKRAGIKPMIFPDTLDFSVAPWVKDDYNSTFLKDFNLREDDILILQATRIVRRKGIELMPPLIGRLNSEDYLGRLVGKQLFNGKRITEDSRFVFILAGYAEHEAEAYRELLEKQMKTENVEYRFLYPRIAADHGELDGDKVYSLFDTYPYADLVSYPSLYEGWGNQFIEAVFSRSPVVLYEYPVYKSDIKHIGYNVISMGGESEEGKDGLYYLSPDVIERTCGQIIDWLLSDDTSQKLEENFRLARKNNSYDYLRKLMRQSMEHYEDF